MGFNRRKMEDQRRLAAEKEAATCRATDVQVLEDAERLITAWNERQAKRMPMLFSPTIGAAITAHEAYKSRVPKGRALQAAAISKTSATASPVRASPHRSHSYVCKSAKPSTCENPANRIDFSQCGQRGEGRYVPLVCIVARLVAGP
jgi:hypothetical protein